MLVLPLAGNANRWKAKNMSQVYDVILADPPWSFKVWNKDTGSGRSAEAHYSTMSLDDICALPIKQLAAKNCVLFMWAVYPSLFDAEKVIKAWGFEYKTLGFEWWKLNKKWSNAIGDFSEYKMLEKLFFFGMGYYTRTNPEPCLLSTRGSMPVAVHNERNFIIAPIREHSQKPDEQYEKIERLYPNARKLELFARRRRTGWDVFGNQVEGSIRLPTKYAPDAGESAPLQADSTLKVLSTS
ncbi:MAG: MT-A70 family methyltransferase [Dokdonella sp.]